MGLEAVRSSGVQRRLGLAWSPPGKVTYDPANRPWLLGKENRDKCPSLVVWGDDFDGDGLLDLAFQEGSNLELWHNRGEDGFATILQLPNTGFIGLADGEGDGDVDLLVTEYEEYEDEADHTHDGTSQATLWYNDGDAEFIRSDRFTLDSEERLWPRLWSAEQSLGAGGAVRLLWFRSCEHLQGIRWRLG